MKKQLKDRISREDVKEKNAGRIQESVRQREKDER